MTSLNQAILSPGLRPSISRGRICFAPEPRVDLPWACARAAGGPSCESFTLHRIGCARALGKSMGHLSDFIGNWFPLKIWRCCWENRRKKGSFLYLQNLFFLGFQSTCSHHPILGVKIGGEFKRQNYQVEIITVGKSQSN